MERVNSLTTINTTPKLHLAHIAINKLEISEAKPMLSGTGSVMGMLQERNKG